VGPETFLESRRKQRHTVVATALITKEAVVTNLGTLVKKVVLIAILGIAFLSGSARSLQIKAAQAKTHDGTCGGGTNRGASCD